MIGHKTFRTWNPRQSFLLPPSPLDWLPEGHLVFFVLDLVGQLDLSAIRDAMQEKDPRGTQPYSPELMVALLVYGYSVGVYSSRKLEKATYEDVAFRVLSGGEHPFFTTINQFRKTHLEALKGLFLQVLKMCQKAGLVKLGFVAVDGTKVQGNASKHKAMSYKRMKQEEERLKGEIEAMLCRAGAEDEAEDRRLGEGVREEDLPEELRRREGRLQKIQQAKRELEEEARAARARELGRQAARAEARGAGHLDAVERKRAQTVGKRKRTEARELFDKNDDDEGGGPVSGGGLPLHEPKAKPDGSPDEKAQMNFTDPDSRIMEAKGGFLQGYNCQTAVDGEHQIIVGQGVSNKSPDNGNLVPMVKQTKENCGEAPRHVAADSGFWCQGVEGESKELGSEVFVATRREKRSEGKERASVEESQGLSNEQKQMRAKVESEEGRKIYARRKAVVEPVYGQIKEARGFRRFLLRGLKAVEAEWSLICTAHNLLKLYRTMGSQGAMA